MLAVATLVLFGVTGLWIAALARRPREVAENEARRRGRKWILYGGILLPVAVILPLLGFGIASGHRMQVLDGGEPLRIDVVARQWEWEVRYPDAGVVLVGEMHLPAARTVDIHLTSADVIHSLWVPRLGRKLDAVPGRTNVLRLAADEPGSHRGQCSEFCGTDHAHMTLRVEVREEADFLAWLADEGSRGKAGAGR